MRRILVGVVVLLAGCGDSPTETTEIKPADVVIGANGSWVDCGLSCYFQGTARNTGAGCATGIQGMVRFYNSLGTEIGSGAWQPHPATLVNATIQPGATFSYRTIDVVDAEVTAAMHTFNTDVSWTDVRCS